MENINEQVVEETTKKKGNFSKNAWICNIKYMITIFIALLTFVVMAFRGITAIFYEYYGESAYKTIVTGNKPSWYDCIDFTQNFALSMASIFQILLFVAIAFLLFTSVMKMLEKFEVISEELTKKIKLDLLFNISVFAFVGLILLNWMFIGFYCWNASTVTLDSSGHKIGKFSPVVGCAPTWMLIISILLVFYIFLAGGFSWAEKCKKLVSFKYILLYRLLPKKSYEKLVSKREENNEEKVKLSETEITE